MAVLTVPALAGEWSVRRTIESAAEGRGRFAGTARFTPDGAGGLLWSERGELELGGHRGPARRSHRIVPAGDAWEVRFDDGRRFHALDLRTGRSELHHPCAPDVYSGHWTVHGPDRFAIDWRVTGPGRDDRIVTDYRRLAPRAAPPAT